MKKIPTYFIFIYLFIIQPVILHSAVVINVSLSDTTAKANEVLYVPVIVDDLTGLGISAFGITVKYDSTIVDWVGIKNTGTLTNGFMALYGPVLEIVYDDKNNYEANIRKISGASVNIINGGGVFIYLGFTVKDNPLGTSTTIELCEVSLQSTQGDPPVSTANCAFYISDTQEKNIESSADSIHFNFSDSTKVRLCFSTGNVIGKSVRITNHTNNVPKNYSKADTISIVNDYFEIESTIENSFNADIEFSIQKGILNHLKLLKIMLLLQNIIV